MNTRSSREGRTVTEDLEKELVRSRASSRFGVGGLRMMLSDGAPPTSIDSLPLFLAIGGTVDEAAD